MKLEYDKEADAAYIYLEYPIKEGSIKRTVPIEDEIILDFDKQDKLVGVEVLNATKHLKKKLLEQEIKTQTLL